MQIGLISNDIVKILFDTHKENLLIGDIVKIYNDENNGVLSQVFKIENSKKNPSNNVANVRIILSLKSNRWYEWEGNIPSKEYKVDKISSFELISYIGGLRHNNPISIGSLSLYDKNIEIEASRLENPTVILSDKQHQRTNIFKLLSQELVKNDVNTVIFDFTGEFSDINDVHRIEAGKDFKLPLDSKGMDIIYNKSLFNLSPETRAVVEDIFMNIQEYIESSDLGFIPFSHFRKVVNDEYEENKIVELILLKNNLTKLEKYGIFANNRAETEALSVGIENNNSIIVDFSGVSALWHKDFIDYIINSNIETHKQKFFVLFGADETNIDSGLINKLYIHGRKSGIKSIVAIDYKSKIMDNLFSIARNMILFSPEINSPKLTEYEIFLNKLNSEETLIFGEITSFVPLFVKIDKISSEEDCKIFDESFNSDNSMVRKIEKIQQRKESGFKEIDENPLAYDEAYNDDEPKDSSYQELESDYSLEEDYESSEEEDYSYAEEKEEYSEDYLEALDYLSDDLPLNHTEEDLEEYEKELNLDNYNESYDEESYKEEKYEDDSVLIDESLYETESYKDDLSDELTNLSEEDDELLDGESSEELSYKAPSVDIPIYSTAANTEEEEAEFVFIEGDTVRHEKYGTGIIKKIIGYGNKKLCSIQFDNLGRRLLDPTLTVLEKI